MIKKTLKGFGGLAYVEIKGVPIRKSADRVIGDILAVSPVDLEWFVAVELIRQRVPIHGEEVTFLRKVLGLSMERFAERLGLTAASVFKWERAAHKRLARINEYAVLGLVADQLSLTPVSLSELSESGTPRRLVLTWPATRAGRHVA